jgi:hypothetical protein
MRWKSLHKWEVDKGGARHADHILRLAKLRGPLGSWLSGRIRPRNHEHAGSQVEGGIDLRLMLAVQGSFSLFAFAGTIVPGKDYGSRG